MFERLASIAVGAVLSFFPARYRSWWQPEISPDFRMGAFLTALAQSLGLTGLLIYRYLIFFQQRAQELGGRVIDAGGETALDARSVQFGMGSVVTLEFLFQPLTLLMLFFIFEGAVRLCAALITEEVVGTLPLHLVALVHDRLEKSQLEAALGPRVADWVDRGDGKEFDLRIKSCRPRPNWDRLMTIYFEDEYYEVVREEAGRPPRRFVYLLKKIPPGKALRGLHQYHPDEVLEEKKD
jgi:hypothetical protein